MRRWQLWEIHEQPWCPSAIRDGATDCLNAAANIGGQYRNVTPILTHLLRHTQVTRIVDLCSGSGGPWPSLIHELTAACPQQPVEVILTDLYPRQLTPQRTPAHARLRYLAEPVDATCVPSGLTGLRTLFTSFHHFPPAVAQSILQNAVNEGQPIAIFEQTRRHPLALLFMLLLPLVALFAIPFVRPFRWSRLFWTLIIPAIPLVLCNDGIVSCLRTYSLNELRELVDRVHAPGYQWQIGRVPSPLSPFGVTYLIGYLAVQYNHES